MFDENKDYLDYYYGLVDMQDPAPKTYKVSGEQNDVLKRLEIEHERLANLTYDSQSLVKKTMREGSHNSVSQRWNNLNL